jgi:magnesium transporter
MPSFRALPTSLRPPTRLKPGDATDASTTPTAPVLVDCGVYVDGVRLAGEYTPVEALSKVREVERTHREAFVWIGLREPTEQQMKRVADLFGLHPLAAEDAVVAHQRPKLERYDESLFLVLKTVNYIAHQDIREIVETGEIMVFVGKNFVVTVRHGEHGGLSEVRQRMDADPEHLRLGPFAVMHAIADYVVDQYLAVTNLMETDIDNIEVVAFTPGGKVDVEPIYVLKREVVELRRCVGPLSVPFKRMQGEHKDLISKEVRRYLRDVDDHQTQAAEQITGYDEMLTSLVQAALARVGMQQNTDMRKISAWAAILAVPTLIAGIYGMNFEYMPVLHLHWGYYTVLSAMVGICTILYRNFRRRDWL